MLDFWFANFLCSRDNLLSVFETIDGFDDVI